MLVLHVQEVLYVAGRQYPLSNYLKEAFVPKSLLAQKDPVGYLSKEIASIKSEIQNTHKKIKNINKEEEQIPSLKKDLNKFDDEIKIIKAKIEELMNTETQGILGKIFGYGMSTKRV